MLEHHRSLAGLCAPTVNAYKRLRPASLSGYWANWGYDHRGATIRVPGERGAGARLEHRLSDGARRGAHARSPRSCRRRDWASSTRAIRARPKAATGSTPSTPRSACRRLARDALDELEADLALVDAVGADLVAQHVAVKRAEWDRYSAATTDWEMREYLPFL